MIAFVENAENLFKDLFHIGATKYNNFWLDTAYDWQTLITAAVAGVPAAIAAYLLWCQVNDQRKQNKRALEQQQISARIKMSHALAQLSEYWKHCFQAIIMQDMTKKTAFLPAIPLEIIMDAAPTVQADTFKIMRDLVIKSQVFESRLRSAHATTQQLLIDVASLDFLTDSLYDFARFEADKVTMTNPSRENLSHQIYHVLDIDHRLCAPEANRLMVESALNRHFSKLNSKRTPKSTDIAL